MLLATVHKLQCSTKQGQVRPRIWWATLQIILKGLGSSPACRAFLISIKLSKYKTQHLLFSQNTLYSSLILSAYLVMRMGQVSPLLRKLHIIADYADADADCNSYANSGADSSADAHWALRQVSPLHPKKAPSQLLTIQFSAQRVGGIYLVITLALLCYVSSFQTKHHCTLSGFL